MHSFPPSLSEGFRSARLLRVGAVVACLLLPGAAFGQMQSSPVDVNLDGVPDLMESFQYFGGGTTGTVGVPPQMF